MIDDRRKEESTDWLDLDCERREREQRKNKRKVRETSEECRVHKRKKEKPTQ